MTNGEVREEGSVVEPATLSISEVSRQTGIPAVGLRNWEERYGLPRPQRTPSGQRRYSEADCAFLADVLGHRAAGLSLPAAMAEAAAHVEEHHDTSIFAGLRRRHPDLRARVIAKATLLALTRAIEDECCARAERPVLVGCFQRQRFYRAARPRWRDLARTAERTVVLADFEHSRLQPSRLVEVSVPEASPLRREWALVCDAPDHAACVVGWERPGQAGRSDRDRLFEAVWSVDPEVVRDASRIAFTLAAPAIPNLSEDIPSRLRQSAPRASVDLRRASGLLERTLDYLADCSAARHT